MVEVKGVSAEEMRRVPALRPVFNTQTLSVSVDEIACRAFIVDVPVQVRADAVLAAFTQQFGKLRRSGPTMSCGATVGVSLFSVSGRPSTR